MIRFKNLKRNSYISKRLERLYKEAFPWQERPPYLYIKIKAMKQNVDFFGIYDNNKFIGLLYTITYKDLVYVFFFAIAEDYRGFGYGSQALAKVRHKYRDKRILLCIENTDKDSNNYEERIRRKDFYMKNGFSDTGIKVREYGVEYEIMSNSHDISYTDFTNLMKSYIGDIFYACFYKIKQI